jgi:hypothetical protein
MKYTKKDLLEIVDGNGELIGNNDIPQYDANADTQANNTTDYNQKIGTQPYRYDMLGRFGFTLMPFMEGKESQEQEELLKELSSYVYDRYKEILEYYYRNPNKLKSDFRKLSSGEDLDNGGIFGSNTAGEILDIIEKHFKKSFNKSKQIDENKVVEDKMVDRVVDKLPIKSNDGEVRDKKIEKIADLINKMNKKDVNKIKNLLEGK